MNGKEFWKRFDWDEFVKKADVVREIRRRDLLTAQGEEKE